MRELFYSFSNQVQELSDQLEKLIISIIPNFAVKEYPGWKGIGFIHSDAGYVLGLFPQKDHVRVLFEHGKALESPEGFFDGEGKQTKFKSVFNFTEIDPTDLEFLILQAIAIRNS